MCAKPVDGSAGLVCGSAGPVCESARAVDESPRPVDKSDRPRRNERETALAGSIRRFRPCRVACGLPQICVIQCGSHTHVLSVCKEEATGPRNCQIEACRGFNCLLAGR